MGDDLFFLFFCIFFAATTVLYACNDSSCGNGKCVTWKYKCNLWEPLRHRGKCCTSNEGHFHLTLVYSSTFRKIKQEKSHSFHFTITDSLIPQIFKQSTNKKATSLASPMNWTWRYIYLFNFFLMCLFCLSSSIFYERERHQIDSVDKECSCILNLLRVWESIFLVRSTSLTLWVLDGGFARYQ